jgi:hypothetical protein
LRLLILNHENVQRLSVVYVVLLDAMLVHAHNIQEIIHNVISLFFYIVETKDVIVCSTWVKGGQLAYGLR